MSRHSPRPTRIALAALLMTAGCQLAVDADLIKNTTPDAGGPGCPEGFVCTPARPDGGGGDHPIIDDSDDDWLLPDSGGPIADGGGDAGPTLKPCSTDSDCSADAFCAADGFCHEDCTDDGCVVRNTGLVNAGSVISAADGFFYWATATTIDALNNPRHDGAIWRMDSNGASTKILGGIDGAELERVLDGQLYFREAADPSGTPAKPLKDVPTTGGEAKNLLWADGPVQDLAVSEHYVWWARPAVGSYTDATMEVWRRPRSGTIVDEKVRTVSGHKLLAATDSSVLYTLVGTYYVSPTDSEGLFIDDLVNPARKLTEELGYYSQAWFVGSDVVLVKNGYKFSYIKSVPAAGGEARFLVPQISAFTSTSAIMTGPWLLWTEWGADGDFQPVSREGRVKIGGDVQVLFQPNELATRWGLALSSDAQYTIYWNSNLKRLFRNAYPAFPCAASADCPDGLSCQPDQTCH